MMKPNHQPDLFDHSRDALHYLTPPLPPGWAGAIGGMQRAADHAEAVSEGWADRATGHLREYIHANPGAVFIAPEVRKWADSRGLDAPPHKRAWGNVFRMAKKDGLIESCGFRDYGDEEMHTQSVRVWREAR